MYLICTVIGIAVGALATYLITQSSGSDPVVAKFNGGSIRASEAFGNIRTRLFDLEEEVYRTKEQAVNESVESKLLETEAKKKNVSKEQLLEQEAGGPADVISDEDVASFLQSKGIDPKDPKIRKEDVKNYLSYRKKFDRRQGYLAKLREGAGVKILLAEPESPKLTVNTDGYPSWGNPKAPVTIVEFSDFQCPFCSRAIPTLTRIKQEYGPEKVRIVFRDMPLPAHPRAVPSALAAHCANEQGKFWEYHDVLFNNQAKLEDEDLKKYAKDLNLDAAKFEECYTSKRHEGILKKSSDEAQNLGIQATPSFVINGALLQGAQPFERFKEKIDRAAKK